MGFNDDADFNEVDPASLNKQFNLKFVFVSSSTGASKAYTGFIDTILDYGVSIKAEDCPARGNNIAFKILKENTVILTGTAKIDSITDGDGIKDVICTFNQFSEQDKQRLLKEASLNQDSVDDYMDDLS